MTTKHRELRHIERRLVDIQFADGGCDIEEVQRLQARRAELDAPRPVKVADVGGLTTDEGTELECAVRQARLVERIREAQ